MKELNTLGYRHIGRMTSDAVTVSVKVALAGTLWGTSPRNAVYTSISLKE